MSARLPVHREVHMRSRRPIILTSVVTVAAFSLLAAGCGGGGSPGVASVASSTTAATTTQNGAVAFAHCMRSHGVPTFPDPDSSGVFDGPKLKQVGVSASRVRAAQSACNHLLPNGIPLAGRITRADQVYYLRGAACMRRHGVPDFPDPTFQNNNVRFNIPSSIDANSSRVKSAVATCQKLIPAGLPYSGSNAP
jgi:hypothetical protein